jgi:hypothetical protein
MRDPGKFSGAERGEIWDRFRAGESIRSIAATVRPYPSAVRQFLLVTGAVVPGERRRSVECSFGR